MIQIDSKYVNDIKLNGTSINRIYLDGEVYWGNTPGPTPPPPSPIPSQYIVVDYIESQGTSNLNMSCINTGFRPSNNTVFDFKLIFPANRRCYATYNGYCPFGAWTWTNASNHSGGDMSFSMIFWDYSNNLILGSQKSGYTLNRYVFQNYQTPFNIRDNTEHVMEGTFSTSAFYFVVDNTQYNLSPQGQPWSGLDGTANTISEFYLFATIWGNTNQNPIPPSTFIQLRMCYFKISDNNVLVRDYVPVYDTVSQKYGLYDKVTQAFYGSSTSVNFTGPSIS